LAAGWDVDRWVARKEVDGFESHFDDLTGHDCDVLVSGSSTKTLFFCLPGKSSIRGICDNEYGQCLVIKM
jgi:hypothetical protein